MKRFFVSLKRFSIIKVGGLSLSYLTLVYCFLISFFFIGSYYYYNFSCDPSFFCKTNSFYRVIDSFHQKYFDLKLFFRSKNQKVSEEIVLIEVDDPSLVQVGRWPWRRDLFSDIVEDIFQYHPKVLAFDMVFSEPSRSLKNQFFDALKKSKKVNRQYFDEKIQLLINEIEKEEPDHRFAQTLKKYSPRLVMGAFYEKENVLETFLGIKKDSYLVEPNSFSGSKSLKKQELKYAAVEGEGIHAGEGINEGEMSFLSIFDPNQDFDQKEASFHQGERKNSIDQQRISSISQWVKNPILKVSHWVKNIPAFSSVTQNTGFFNAELDSDGVIRRSRLLVRSNLFYVPSLAFKSFLVAKNYNGELFFNDFKDSKDYEILKNSKGQENLIDLKVTKDKKFFKSIRKFNIVDLQNGDTLFKVPIDNEGKILINYSSADDFYTISALDFLNQSPYVEVKKEFREKNKTFLHQKLYQKKDFLKDKILIFGVTAKAVFDMRATPVHKNYPGVKVHAHILSNLLQKKFLFSSNKEKVFSFWLLFFLSLVSSFCFYSLRAKFSLFLFSFSFLGLIFLDFSMFINKGLHSSFLLLILFLILEYGGFILIKYLIEEAEKKKLKNTFSKYVSPLVFKEILAAPKKIEIQGKEENVTIFLSDIRNFSQLSEKMKPSFLNQWLSSYFTAMTEIILKHRGTLDKYMGDGMISFFGAPIKDRLHVKNACFSALSQVEKMKELNRTFHQKRWPVFDIGIGLNTGNCYVGDIGSKDLRNYTVLGDTVNLTARVEQLNKYYGTKILLTENTYKFIKKDFLCREIDFILLKGKKVPLSIFELLSQKRDKNSLKFNHSKFNSFWIRDYNKAYAMFRRRDFKNAKKYFLKTLSQKTDDPVSKIHLKHCNQFIKKPHLIKDSNFSYKFKKS